MNRTVPVFPNLIFRGLTHYANPQIAAAQAKAISQVRDQAVAVAIACSSSAVAAMVVALVSSIPRVCLRRD